MLISKFDNTDIEINIREFEKKYKFKFPIQYRNFLFKYNGGETPDTDFRISKISSDIIGFYGLGNVDESYNYSFFESFGGLSNFLNDFVIPVATNVCGDYIIIGIGNENNGIMYFYYHDEPKKYIKLTDDFLDFVSRCKSKMLGHIPTIEERLERVKKNGNFDEIDNDIIELWQAEIDKYGNMKQETVVL